MEWGVAHKHLRVDGRLCYESNLEPRTLNHERLHLFFGARCFQTQQLGTLFDDEFILNSFPNPT